ncbi:hypothetical protein GIV17_00085 [Pseudomonas syringae]|nr:hypothetical protein [Pseudomonas syringae]MCF5739253.1 hypothetical protein [Pseudomonas syringae]MCF5754948.1 hypothetical protein [Pseudomonas syringae]
MRLSFGTLQRGNAGRDALRRREDAERPERHDDAERRTITSCPRRPTQCFSTIVEIIVPHAPAWECSSRRSASQEDAERPERHATQSVAR